MALLAGVLCALLSVAAEEPFRPALRRGEMRLALEQARAQDDALLAARGEVEVTYHAGDLRGALELASGGLLRHPGDAWLRWRACDIAANLGRTRRAREELDAFRQARALTSSDSAPETERTFWNDQLAFLSGEVEALEARDRRSREALLHARWTAASILIGGALALVLLARAPRPRAAS